eukprot:m.241490 g.241490  ORF g.241490 m.241490 type:complete len:302 (+) comp24463_c0_seq1:34-939(+)
MLASKLRVAAVLRSSTRSSCSQTLAHKTVSIVDTNGKPGIVQVMQSSVAGSPPLLLLTGTGQSCVSYSNHVRALADKLKRSVYCVDLRGQGQTQLSLDDVSLKAHVRDCGDILQALAVREPVDVCGFSFGGRVGLALAALRPDLVRRLVLTGVPGQRDAVGRTILRSWHVALQSGDLTTLAWAAMATAHSPWFVTRYEKHLPEWTKAMARGSSVEGVRAILAQSHADDPTDEMHSLTLATRVACPTLLLTGDGDRLAPPETVAQLAAVKGWPVRVLADAAHMVPIEQPAAWRAHIVEFLSA